MSILSQARYTLGAEEELQVVDAASLQLAAHDYASSARQFPDDVAHIDMEIHQCVLEIKTGICTRPQQLAGELEYLRSRARRWAATQGQRVFAAGLHPTTDWRAQATHQKSHYQHLLNEYQDVARSNLVFGLHVHVGLPEVARRMAVMNLLRADLPLLLALSASSPFIGGQDTGLQSWRQKVFDKYPRTGIPEVWPNETAYNHFQQRLVKTGCLEPGFMLWEDLRLHRKYGTLEVRICDANPSLWRTELIAALVQASAASYDLALAAGEELQPLARSLIEENKWRAGRHGLTGRVVDWQHDEEIVTRVAFNRWYERIAPAARLLGTLTLIEDGLTRALFQGTSADHQRLLRQRHGSLDAVLRALIAETAAPHTHLQPHEAPLVEVRRKAA